MPDTTPDPVPLKLVQPSGVRRSHFAVALGSILAGLGLASAPPVFVSGVEPQGPVTCHVERTGVLQGQRVCEINDVPPAPTEGEFRCVSWHGDGGCALMDWIAVDPGPAATAPGAAYDARSDGGMPAAVPGGP